METVEKDLSGFDRDALVKRVVSLEFNRFLEQYREARDLNVDLARKDHAPRERREKQGFSRVPEGPMRSLFINLGSADGFDKGRMLGYLCGVTGLTGQSIGRIMMKDMYSFVDIDADRFDDVIAQFRGANYRGRKIRVDEGDGRGGGAQDRPHPGGPRKKFQKER
jgi:ATP-dependent RNA helicase DeaD